MPILSPRVTGRPFKPKMPSLHSQSSSSKKRSLNDVVEKLNKSQENFDDPATYFDVNLRLTQPPSSSFSEGSEQQENEILETVSSSTRSKISYVSSSPKENNKSNSRSASRKLGSSIQKGNMVTGSSTKIPMTNNSVRSISMLERSLHSAYESGMASAFQSPDKDKDISRDSRKKLSFYPSPIMDCKVALINPDIVLKQSQREDKLNETFTVSPKGLPIMGKTNNELQEAAETSVKIEMVVNSESEEDVDITGISLQGNNAAVNTVKTATSSAKRKLRSSFKATETSSSDIDTSKSVDKISKSDADISQVKFDLSISESKGINCKPQQTDIQDDLVSSTVSTRTRARLSFENPKENLTETFENVSMQVDFTKLNSETTPSLPVLKNTEELRKKRHVALSKKRSEGLKSVEIQAGTPKVKKKRNSQKVSLLSKVPDAEKIADNTNKMDKEMNETKSTDNSAICQTVSSDTLKKNTRVAKRRASMVTQLPKVNEVDEMVINITEVEVSNSELNNEEKVNKITMKTRSTPQRHVRNNTEVEISNSELNSEEKVNKSKTRSTPQLHVENNTEVEISNSELKSAEKVNKSKTRSTPQRHVKNYTEVEISNSELKSAEKVNKSKTRSTPQRHVKNYTEVGISNSERNNEEKVNKSSTKSHSIPQQHFTEQHSISKGAKVSRSFNTSNVLNSTRPLRSNCKDQSSLSLSAFVGQNATFLEPFPVAIDSSKVHSSKSKKNHQPKDLTMVDKSQITSKAKKRKRQYLAMPKKKSKTGQSKTLTDTTAMSQTSKVLNGTDNNLSSSLTLNKTTTKDRSTLKNSGSKKSKKQVSIAEPVKSPIRNQKRKIQSTPYQKKSRNFNRSIEADYSKDQEMIDEQSVESDYEPTGWVGYSKNQGSSKVMNQSYKTSHAVTDSRSFIENEALDRAGDILIPVKNIQLNRIEKAHLFRPASSVEWKNARNSSDELQLHKYTSDPSAAFGQIKLKPNGKKGKQKNQHDRLHFVVMIGQLTVTIHQTTFPAISGDFFTVPEGNYYNIENIGEYDARLYFTQIKNVV